MSNNSQTNARNVVKICFQAIWDVNFTKSIKRFIRAFIIKIDSGKKCRVRFLPFLIKSDVNIIAKRDSAENNGKPLFESAYIKIVICNILKTKIYTTIIQCLLTMYTLTFLFLNKETILSI